MKKNPLFSRRVPTSKHGYSAFPMDNLANFTSVAGYLIPVYWDYLEPGDKVTCQTVLRTRTQPLSAPAMATVIERLEWFAVPIQQLYKLFSQKYYGINDVESDVLPTKVADDLVPWIDLSDLNDWMAALPTSFTAQSAIPTAIPTLEEAKRLCDAIGLPDVLGSAALPSGYTFPGSISVLPFAAYQKIYYDHYRLTDREENEPMYYNFDSFFGTPGVSAQVLNTAPDYRFNKLFFLHKRPYMRDYFTSMQVSPLFASQDINASGNDLGSIQNWISGLTSIKSGLPNAATSPTLGNVAVVTSNSSTVRPANQGTSSPSLDVVAGSLNPGNIRSLYAVEKLLEVTRRAKKHYDMQTLAHFGVSVPKGLSGECYKLGTHEQYLQIGDVVSTATTASSGGIIGSLGELAGRGSSSAQSKKVHFEADCHCVLMCIYSAEPVVNVAPEGLPRILSKTRTSEWYKSEFDSLGMQPVFRRELFITGTSTPTDGSQVIGWQYRYYENKAKYNRSFGGVANTYFQEWALNRTSIGAGTTLSRNFFYVWPTDLNDILQVQYNGVINYNARYSQDYFVNQVYFDVIKSSKKTIYGEPNL